MSIYEMRLLMLKVLAFFILLRRTKGDPDLAEVQAIINPPPMITAAELDSGLKEPIMITMNGVEMKQSSEVFTKGVTTTEPEAIKKDDTIKLALTPAPRRLQLMIANSNPVKMGTFPLNEFALSDNGTLEEVGKKVIVTLMSFRPKAMSFGDEIIVNYDTESEVFQKIVADSRERGAACSYGIELTLDYKGEPVTLYCGTRSLKQQLAKVSVVEGQKYLLTPMAIQLKICTFFTIHFKEINYKWMGVELFNLKGKKLYNIIQAIERGYWLTTGCPVKIPDYLVTELQAEWAERRISAKKVAKYIKANQKWEQKHGRGCAWLS